MPMSPREILHHIICVGRDMSMRPLLIFMFDNKNAWDNA